MCTPLWLLTHVPVSDPFNHRMCLSCRRVGHHAFDRSYVQFYFGGGATPGGALNMSMEYSVGGDGNGDIDVLMTPQGDAKDWEIQVTVKQPRCLPGGS